MDLISQLSTDLIHDTNNKYMATEVYKTLDYNTKIPVRGFYRGDATSPIIWVYSKGNFDPSSDVPQILIKNSILGAGLVYMDTALLIQTNIISATPSRNTGGKIILAAEPDEAHPLDIMFSFWDYTATPTPTRTDVFNGQGEDLKMTMILVMDGLGYFG
jgi:hypothetical protein